MFSSIRFGILPAISLFSVIFCSCSSLREARFRDNPDFEKHAERFSLNISRMLEKPLGISATPVQYVLKNPALDSLSCAITRRPTGNSSTEIDERVLRIRKFRYTRPQLTEKLVIANDSEDLFYEIWGGEVEDNTTVMEAMGAPQPNAHEYWIFDGAREIGKLRVHKARSITKYKLVMDVVLHDRSFDLEYEREATMGWGNHFFAFDYDDRMVALFEVTGKGTGEAWISSGLADEVKSDIMIAFALADVVKTEVWTYLAEIGYW